MSLIDSLTPKDTEEVKPGLFIQRKLGSYKQIHPSAWNGKIIWKNFLFGTNPIRNFLWFAILMFLVFAYTNDVAQYKGFYEEVQGNPFAYCQSLGESQVVPECTPELEDLGLCQILNLSIDLEVINENTNTLSNNS